MKRNSRRCLGLSLFALKNGAQASPPAWIAGVSPADSVLGRSFHQLLHLCIFQWAVFALVLVCGCGDNRRPPAPSPLPVSQPLVETNDAILSETFVTSEPADGSFEPSLPSVSSSNIPSLISLNDGGTGIVETLILDYDSFFALLETIRETAITESGEREPTRTEFIDILLKQFDGYGPEARGRFVFTQFRGFIDIKHFLSACYAARLPLVTQTMVLIAGESVEYQQAERGSQSAWSVEDLPSNAAGVEFSTRMSEPDTARALNGDLNVFFLGRLGGGAPIPADIESFRTIKNFGYSPLVDPMTAPVRVSSDGIRYLSSGSDALDAERLDSLRRTVAPAR